MTDAKEAKTLFEKYRSASFWTQTRTFKKLVKWAFGVCDRNKSGRINKTELYAGFLLVHLNLAKYAGPAACYPPTREYIEELFDASDDDNSGDIDETEFSTIMVILCSQITSRIAAYYTILILLVPYLISWTLDALDFVGVDRTIMRIDGMWDKYAPNVLQTLTNLVPDSTWETLPETLVSVALFYLAIPICWNTMDSYFRSVAERTDTAAISKEKKDT